MTPHDAALLMMRRHADPELIVAYLLEETHRAGHADPLRLSQHPMDRMRFTWADIKAAFTPLARAFAAAGQSIEGVAAALEPADRQSDYVLATEGETPC